VPLFLIQIVVAIVLSIASTLIQQALAKRPEEQRKPGVRGEIQVGGDNPLACILGRYATAGQFEYANTWGTPGGLPNAKFVKVVSVSDLPVRAVRLLRRRRPRHVRRHAASRVRLPGVGVSPRQ
jgi:hypothetical protein